MLNPPGGPELLEMARAEERRLGDPHYPGNPRYLAALIARAREIAARESELGERLGRRELQLFEQVYGPGAGAGDDARQIRQWLYTLNIRLAADLRARRLGDVRHSGILELLEVQVRARLAITNPKYLDTAYRHE